MGIQFHKGHNVWVKDGKLIPNWTPDEVKFEDKIYVRNLKSILEGKNMDEEQEKYIVGQIYETIKSLENKKRSLTLQMACNGHRLWEVLNELDKARNALEGFSDEKDIKERRSDENS